MKKLLAKNNTLYYNFFAIKTRKGKKIMKKFFAILMSLALMLSLAVPAMAEGTYEVIVKNAANHEYRIYQIFTGDLAKNAENKEVLSNLKYGTDYVPAGKTVGADAEVPANPTGIIPTGNGTAMTTSDDVATIDGLVAGYYMIKDVTTNLPAGEGVSAVIFQVVGDTEIFSKHTSTPKVEKKIDDTNDSTDATNGIVWQDSADHDIGDLIDFKLEMTVPDTFDLFEENDKEYPFTFHDTEEQGLTFQLTTVHVYVVNGTEKTEITEGYEVKPNPEDGHTFDVVFADLTEIANVAEGSKIIVEYKSRLNESAVFGKQGNVNTVYGEYLNYYDTDEPEHEPVKTPNDSVIAFTYKVVVNKVDENKKPLPGAEFTLEKFVKVLPTGKTETETVKAEGSNDILGYWIAVQQVETQPGTTFTFEGLDDGEYRLTETETPAGYNDIEPIYFTVEATHEEKWEGEERTIILTSLTAGDLVTGEVDPATGEGTKERDFKDTGIIETNIENKSGTVLPETGGMGTTIFYVVGGVMVAAAAILLITKKRLSNNA